MSYMHPETCECPTCWGYAYIEQQKKLGKGNSNEDKVKRLELEEEIKANRVRYGR